jgi:hypothetical protein
LAFDKPARIVSALPAHVLADGWFAGARDATGIAISAR